MKINFFYCNIVNIRRHLDYAGSSVLKPHTAPSQHEMLMKDPLAKHKAVIEEETEAKSISSGPKQDEIAPKPSVSSLPFSIFSDNPSTESAKSKNSKIGSAAVAPTAQRLSKPSLETRPAVATPLPFNIFSECNPAADENVVKKDSKEVKPTAEHIKPPALQSKVAPLGKLSKSEYQLGAVLKSSSTEQSSKESDFPFGDDNVTINTRIARMDIDAMFFDDDINEKRSKVHSECDTLESMEANASNIVFPTSSGFGVKSAESFVQKSRTTRDESLSATCGIEDISAINAV